MLSSGSSGARPQGVQARLSDSLLWDVPVSATTAPGAAGCVASITTLTRAGALDHDVGLKRADALGGGERWRGCHREHRARGSEGVEPKRARSERCARTWRELSQISASAGHSACFSGDATVRRTTQSGHPTGRFWPKVAPHIATLIRGVGIVCRDFLDGASRTRTGDVLGAIRACAALESSRFAGILVQYSRGQPARDTHRLQAIAGSLPLKTAFRGQGLWPELAASRARRRT
jgi:hypothetical protein